ncbi:MAG TPA: kelch repeat-containing protein [bacterium]|nr:kelch repeat-containing protein [bacterium]
MRNFAFGHVVVVILFAATGAWGASGGPDAFGYTWNDTFTYNWVDVSDGTLITFEDDEIKGPYPLGFDFDFYGETYNQIYISANGRLTFVDQPETYNIPCIPSASPYLGYIALYWDDLDPESAGAIYLKLVGAEPNRFLIIQYQDVLAWGSTTDVLTAEVVLSEQNSDIFFQYLNPTVENGGNATIGIMSPNGEDGLSIVCNSAVLTAETAYHIMHPPYITFNVTDDAAAAAPGDTAQFTLEVRNVTGEDATVIFSTSDNDWAAVADPGQLQLARGESGTVDVAVQVPSDAMQWSMDQVTVTATWLQHPTLQVQRVLTTTAGADWSVLSGALPTLVQKAAVISDAEWLYVFSNYLAPGIVGTLYRFNLNGDAEQLDSADPAVNVTDGVYLWDKLVFAGGVDANGELTDKLSVFDLSDEQWLDGFTTPLPMALAATVVHDDQLYVIGGFDGEAAMPDLWRFDPESATWEKLASMNEARMRPVAGVIGDKIIVAGGADLMNLSSAEMYDPEQDVWSAISPLPEEMYAAADCTCNDKFYVIGGLLGDQALDIVYGYDPDLSAWFPVSLLQTARFDTEADLLEGNIVVAGGNRALFSPVNDAELLDLGCTDEQNIHDGEFGPDDDTDIDDDVDDDDTILDDDTPDDDTDDSSDDDDDDDEGCCGC